MSKKTNKNQFLTQTACEKIFIISKRINFFNFPNHGFVEIVPDIDSYKLILSSTEKFIRSEFKVI